MRERADGDARHALPVGQSKGKLGRYSIRRPRSNEETQRHSAESTQGERQCREARAIQPLNIIDGEQEIPIRSLEPQQLEHSARKRGSIHLWARPLPGQRGLDRRPLPTRERHESGGIDGAQQVPQPDIWKLRLAGGGPRRKNA
jgi:hypothetical protein